MNRALGVMGVARVVRDDANCGAVSVQLLEQSHHGVTIFGIEVACRLVRQQDQRGAINFLLVANIMRKFSPGCAARGETDAYLARLP